MLNVIETNMLQLEMQTSDVRACYSFTVEDERLGVVSVVPHRVKYE